MAVQVFIDGAENPYVLSGSVTPRLNRPAAATCRIPMRLATGECGSRLKVVDDGNLIFHGMILTISDEGDEDRLYTEYVAADPMELWQWRPARDGVASGDSGDFSDPTFLYRLETGPQIMLEILQQSENAGDVPSDAEGPLFITYGVFETGGENLSGAPVDWPMTISEIANLLTSTGELDIVLVPIDSGGAMAEVSCYNGDYGTNLSGSISFDFKTGQYNARALRRVQDMTTMCNKLWYYLGPKKSLQRWSGSITGDGAYWANPNFGGLDMAALYPRAPSVIERAGFSRADYGERMDIQIFDSRGSTNNQGAGEINARALFNRRWLMESYIRAQPREMIHITPVRGTPLNFGIGDLIGVSAGPAIRGGFTGAQRVFEYTYSWDEDGVTEITDIGTSPSAD
jgi:hypothetical protein